MVNCQGANIPSFKSLIPHACVVAVVAAVCALGLKRDAPDTGRYLEEAHSIAMTGTFSLGNEVPTLRDAPGLPFVLSVFIRMGIVNPETPARLLNAMCAGAVGLLCGIVTRWLAGVGAGTRLFSVVAVYYCGLFPTILGSCLFALSEVLYGALFLAGNVLALSILRARGAAGWPVWALVGLAWGVATLFRAVPYAYPFAALPILVALSRGRGERLVPLLRRSVIRALVCLAAFLAATLPWTVRNAIHFKAFVPVCFGTGTYLYVGASKEWNAEWPDFDPSERLMEETPGMTRLEADKELGRRAADVIMRDPAGWLRLGCLKAERFFLEVPGSKKQIGSKLLAWGLSAVNMVNLLLAAVGAAVLLRTPERRWLAWLVLPVFYSLALHVLLYSMGRFRVPVEPYLCVLAVVGALSLVRRFLEPPRDCRSV